MKKQVQTVKSVDRALSILNMVSETSLSVREIAQRLDISTVGAMKMLNSLVNSRMLVKVRGDQYALSSQTCNYARNYVNYYKFIIDSSQEYLLDLSYKLHNSIRLVILEDINQVNLVEIDMKNNAMINVMPHRLLGPPWLQPSGLLLLAHADKTIQKKCFEQYPSENDEYGNDFTATFEKIKKENIAFIPSSFPQITYCAVPVYGAGGRVIAAVSAHILDTAIEEQSRFIIETANSISSEVGYRPDHF